MTHPDLETETGATTILFDKTTERKTVVPRSSSAIPQKWFPPIADFRGGMLARGSVFILLFSEVSISWRASRAQKSPRKFHRFNIIFEFFRIFSKLKILFFEKIFKKIFFFEKYINIMGIEISKVSNTHYVVSKKNTDLDP